MNISDSFFCEEVREGFTVPPMMKRCWGAQMEVLQVIDSICKKYNISYFADYGTLLGAVRHKGFIPWDDDIDIGMLRKDYWRFMKYAKEELPDGFVLRSPEENARNGLTPYFSGIINSRGICTDEDFLKRYHGFPYPAGIDIFPVDAVPNNPEEDVLQVSMVRLVDTAILFANDKNAEKSRMEYLLGQIKELCGVELSWNSTLKQQLCGLFDSLCGMFSEEQTEYVKTCVEWMDMRQNRIPSRAYEFTLEVPFEMITVPVPVGYEEILSREYGAQYMIPKYFESDHEYPSYKEEELMLKEYLIKHHMSGERFYIDTGY